MMVKPSIVLGNIIVAALLLGCVTTPNEIRSIGPAMVMQSIKPAKEVAICIADRWENVRVLGDVPQVSFRPTEQGYTVSWGKNYIVDVIDHPQGSTSRIYKHMVISLGEDPRMGAIGFCQ